MTGVVSDNNNANQVLAYLNSQQARLSAIRDRAIEVFRETRETSLFSIEFSARRALEATEALNRNEPFIAWADPPYYKLAKTLTAFAKNDKRFSDEQLHKNIAEFAQGLDASLGIDSSSPAADAARQRALHALDQRNLKNFRSAEKQAREATGESTLERLEKIDTNIIRDMAKAQMEVQQAFVFDSTFDRFKKEKGRPKLHGLDVQGDYWHLALAIDELKSGETMSGGAADRVFMFSRGRLPNKDEMLAYFDFALSKLDTGTPLGERGRKACETVHDNYGRYETVLTQLDALQPPVLLAGEMIRQNEQQAAKAMTASNVR